MYEFGTTELLCAYGECHDQNSDPLFNRSIVVGDFIKGRRNLRNMEMPIHSDPSFALRVTLVD